MKKLLLCAMCACFLSCKEKPKETQQSIKPKVDEGVRKISPNVDSLVKSVYLAIRYRNAHDSLLTLGLQKRLEAQQYYDSTGNLRRANKMMYKANAYIHQSNLYVDSAQMGHHPKAVSKLKM